MPAPQATKRQRAALHENIIDAMTTALVVLDHDLHVVHINAAAEQLLQASKTHAQGQPLTALVLLSDDVHNALHNMLETQQPFTEREAIIRLPDNVTHYVDLTVAMIEGGRTGMLLLEMQALNRLQRINRDEESVARQETARHLVRGLAHEIKNPLGGIRGAAQLLEMELESDELKEYTGVIIGEADRLKQLVDRLLGPQQQPDIQPVNVLRVVERVIALMEAEYPGRFAWSRDYDPSLPDIEADEAQLVQAVMNVVRNACEALQQTEEPRITIRTRAVRQFTIGHTLHRLVLQLEIVDNGPGVEPGMEERIFFPMISGRADGTGLGLAITQNIINQLHGSVQVVSRPGQTRFTIYMPFAYQAPVATQTATHSPHSPHTADTPEPAPHE